MIPNMFRLSIILLYNMISLMTWNVRGAISSTMCLSAFLDKEKCDIVIITEHKLKESTKHYLETIHDDYTCCVKLDDQCTMQSNLPFIGRGGVAIMYRKSLMFSVKEVTCYNTNRITAIQLNDSLGNIYYIFGVYLPSDSNIEMYIEELSTLENLYTYYSGYGKVIIAGDFNGSLVDSCDTNLTKAKLLLNFVSKYNLCIPSKDFATDGEHFTFTQKKKLH